MLEKLWNDIRLIYDCQLGLEESREKKLKELGI